MSREAHLRLAHVAVVCAVVLFAHLASPRADSKRAESTCAKPAGCGHTAQPGSVNVDGVVIWFETLSQPVLHAGEWFERQLRRIAQLPPWGSKGGVRGALFELGVVDVMSVADWAGLLPALDFSSYRIFATPPVTGPKSSSFGWRRHPVLRRRRLHKGVDFRTGSGTRVRAAAPGRITYAARMGTYGKLVKIEHGRGLETRYAHLRRIDVRKGDYIAAGTIVGLVGATGRVTGPHLHFEVRFHGEPLDPETTFIVPLFSERPKTTKRRAKQRQKRLKRRD